MQNPATTNHLEGYRFIRVLGVGNSSTVYLASDKTNHVWAVKRIQKTEDAQIIAKVRRETELMKSISSPFAVQYKESYENEDAIYVVMEYCAGGTLTNVLDGKMLDESVALIIMTQLLFALRHIHKEAHVMHRDIKIENILIDSLGRVKLSDFGFSTSFMTDDPMQRTICGSAAYTAPEVVKQDAYTTKADIWSAGVVFYVLLTGEFPFVGHSIEECIKAIVENDVVWPSNVSESCLDLLAHMLEKDPQKRASAEELLRHPAITGSKYFYEIRREAYDLTEGIREPVAAFDVLQKLDKSLVYRPRAMRMGMVKRGHFKNELPHSLSHRRMTLLQTTGCKLWRASTLTPVKKLARPVVETHLTCVQKPADSKLLF